MNREFLTVVTRKGQITVPAEVRRMLGIQEGDRIALVVEDDSRQVCLMRSESVVARTAGFLKATDPPLSAEELRAAGEQAIAEEAVARNGG